MQGRRRKLSSVFFKTCPFILINLYSINEIEWPNGISLSANESILKVWSHPLFLPFGNDIFSLFRSALPKPFPLCRSPHTSFCRNYLLSPFSPLLLYKLSPAAVRDAHFRYRPGCPVLTLIYLFFSSIFFQ